MVESDKGGGPSSTGAPSQPPIGGLVVDPKDIKTNPSLTKFLRERISGAFVSGLVAIGILRPRRADGELGPRHWMGLFLFIATIFAVIIIWTSVHIVQPGNVAVPVTFGHAGEPLEPGIHITLPFTNAYSMSTRTQNYTMSASPSDGPSGSVDSAVTVLGSDGGSGTVNATVLYRVDRSKATDVYRSLGRNYGPAFVRPTARGCVRDAFTRYGIVDGASVKSGAIQDDIAKCVKAKLESAGLLLQAFQLRSVTPSASVQSAVDAKVQAQQKLFQQAFDEATALKQADIRAIQAQAVSNEERIVQCGGHMGTISVNGKSVQTIVPNAPSQCDGLGLTQAYLQYAYIQALNNLATSGKATVIVGSNGSPLPVITVPSGSTGATP
jgi:regulator of protease activity HflC (stomatin/prohibitin superfamily)